jgi:nucleotide-binding universal stress UspA family protein
VNALVWLVEGTWEGCVEGARALLPRDAEVTLLYVVASDLPEAAGGAMAGLLGRGRPGRRDPGERIAALSEAAARDLLEAAAARLGRPARRVLRRGRVEREVVEQAAGADLLVAARDGDRSRLGPRSLGPATRFVVDHAPCQVLLLWPDEVPALGSIPPPPDHPPPPPHER